MCRGCDYFACVIKNISIPCFIALCRYCVLCKLKVCVNTAIFQQHLLTSCFCVNILVILAIFQTFSLLYLLWWSVISDFLKINLFIYLFTYLWLCWFFVAARGLSLVAASGGYSSLQCAGFSFQWLLLSRSTGSRCAGFSSCGPRAPVVVAHGL